MLRSFTQFYLSTPPHHRRPSLQFTVYYLTFIIPIILIFTLFTLLYYYIIIKHFF